MLKKTRKWNKEYAKTWKLWFDSFESLQIFIFNFHFDQQNSIFIKVTKGHRSSIKVEEVPCVNWTKHYQNHGYMCQLCTQSSMYDLQPRKETLHQPH